MMDLKLFFALVAFFVGSALSVDITKPAGSEVMLAEGAELHLECEDSEGPLAWKHNGMPVTDGERFKITETEGGKKSVLHLDAVTSADKGRYVCSVDPFTEDEISVKVEEGGEQAATIIEPDTVSTTLPAGGTLQMKCVAGPSADLFWAHKGMELDQDSRILVTKAKDINTQEWSSLLSIRDVTAEDAGKYECKDKNDPIFNVDDVTVEIGEEGNVQIVDPAESNLQVKEGNIINLKCSADHPTKLVWFKGDKAIAEDAIIADVEEDGKTISLLTVEDAESGDSGYYSCRNAEDATDEDGVTVKVKSGSFLGGIFGGGNAISASFSFICAAAVMCLVFTKRE